MWQEASGAALRRNPTSPRTHARHEPWPNLTEAEPACHVRASHHPAPSGRGPRSGRTSRSSAEPGQKRQVQAAARGRREGEGPSAVAGERAAAAEKPTGRVQVLLREARPLRTARFDENLIKEEGKKIHDASFSRQHFRNS